MTMWLPDLLQPDLPKYLAIAQAIVRAIQQGDLRPGTRLPPQRRLADALSVTTGTITRAYAEAERQGLLEARVGSGTYVRQRGQVDSFRFSEQRSEVDLGFTLALQDGQCEDIRRMLTDLVANPVQLNTLLGYMPETGLRQHREAAARWLKREGVDRPADDILLCGGGQNGLFIALSTLCDTGDTVLSEGLTYTGFSLAARHLRLRHIGLPMDEEGLIPGELRTACERYRPRAVYLMPQLHNPTGAQMSDARKRELLAICRQYQVMVIEDNVQSALLADLPEPMVAMDPDQVIALSSCSKCFSGGLRVGFLVPPPAWLDRFRVAMRVNHWMITPLACELVARWIDHPERDRSLARQQAACARRHELTRDILQGFDYQAHPCALSGWLRLPARWRARDLAQALHQVGIDVKPADVFVVGQYRTPEAIRICVGGDLSEETLANALHRIRTTLTHPGDDSRWLQDCTI
ncbi:MAG: PLP-dependent aminotransferase family protein [Natronospirillum sp.]|uniref:aminotransferase-like domain-containing protein n=1 Tax=Natronospirillum sp. TaxID=2812955 RepID=UPI0025DEF2C1|nr:PLP-dependent aminotransferase family protein [Natronospirillum sp.]MCH8551462.1 PLP-dependent aminotransferase family protein [Natronospirillum sp.]